MKSKKEIKKEIIHFWLYALAPCFLGGALIILTIIIGTFFKE